MLDLIKQIDFAWVQKISIYDIEPNEILGYFSFRNKVIRQYRKSL